MYTWNIPSWSQCVRYFRSMIIVQCHACTGGGVRLLDFSQADLEANSNGTVGEADWVTTPLGPFPTDMPW